MRLTQYLWGAWNGVIALRLQPDGLRLSDGEIAETLELARWLLREGLQRRHCATPTARSVTASRCPRSRSGNPRKAGKRLQRNRVSERTNFERSGWLQNSR